MKFIGNYFGKKDEIVIDPKFKKMSKDELILTANTLKDANENLKLSLEELNKNNKLLKENLLNKEKKSSEIKNFVQDIGYTLFSFEDIDNNEKNKELNDFIYDQYLLYGGLEEEEINDLNQIKIKEDNWTDNKDFFIFKQKIIERNYQELFKNILISEELNKLFDLNEIIENKNKENNNIENNIKKEEKKIVNNNKESESNKTNDKKDRKDNGKHKIKSGKKKEKNKETKKEVKKFNIDNLNPEKDKKINYRLDDFNFLDD